MSSRRSSKRNDSFGSPQNDLALELFPRMSMSPIYNGRINPSGESPEIMKLLQGRDEAKMESTQLRNSLGEARVR